jgi:uncharacterized PurR-regulated membrane protein YhhQ (DUF165 family)
MSILFHLFSRKALHETKNLLPVKPKIFVSYPFIVSIMTLLQVMTVIYDDKNFLFFGLNVSAGWLILMPIMQYLFQIVAEVYGWQYARQMVWCNFVVNLLMTLIIFSFKYIPFSGFNHEEIKTAFIVFMDNDKLIDMPCMLIGMLISNLISSALMTWSKFHWNGRHILIRVLVLHLVSEIIILSTSFITEPLTGYTLQETWIWTRQLLLARTIIMIALLPFARYAVYLLQHKVEGVVVFDYKKDFKIFTFKVSLDDSAQFNADQWYTLSPKMKKEFNCERSVLLYNSTNGGSMRIF